MSRLKLGLAGVLLFVMASAAGAKEDAGAATRSDWGLPDPEVCEPRGGLRGWPIGVDAPPVSFEPGDTFSVEQLPLLRAYFPPELWSQRERFFYEGMRLEIGTCFADYSPPAFFLSAGASFRGKARLLPNGGLADYTAGLPFAAEDIDAGDEEAGIRWAWNVALRYQGAGFRGRFRITDMVGREGRAEPFEGELFKIQLAHRADRAAEGYTAKGARSKHWVAGGKFSAPFDAREYAWRQLRDLEHERVAERSDDLHAYLPDWRRVRRLSASGVEGLYMPSFSVGVVKPSTMVGMGGSVGASSGVAAMASGADAITTKRSGFEGLEIRPLLYHWRVVGVQDVIAPINANRPSYPAIGEREFGPWGLSFASDRWDLRRALILEGRIRAARGAKEVSRMVLYVDLQNLTPLFYMSFDRQDEAIDVGVYVGRWSEERADYPRWPDDPERPVRVIDSVGAAFANLADIGGWRRETWDAVSTPPDDRTVRRWVSVGNLTKGR
ncbi:MAG: DUF1329 domain-containing protein [Myxococcota bacterium]